MPPEWSRSLSLKTQALHTGAPTSLGRFAFGAAARREPGPAPRNLHGNRYPTRGARWEGKPRLGKWDPAATLVRSPTGRASAPAPGLLQPARTSRRGLVPRHAIRPMRARAAGRGGRAAGAENPARGRRVPGARQRTRSGSTRGPRAVSAGPERAPDSPFPCGRAASPGLNGPRDPGPGSDPALLHLG